MFAFLRKYQRYFFLFISIVIIISFSFFGTYNSLPSEDARSQTAFYATDGTAISRSDLDQMVTFLGTDAEDKVLFGGYWGPNFLNDGVIKKNFLQTGLAEVIAKQFPDDIAIDLKTRLVNEKRYELYAHPNASFVSTESVWAYAAPGLIASYDFLRNSSNPVDLATFNARVKLYLGEKRLPASYLRQYLRFQEKQYSWLVPDPNLDRIDLSLFGYHTLDDWFGPSFVRLAAEFIINSAKTAELQGYSVPMDEAIADLNRNAALSFKQNVNSPNLGVTNSQEYLNEQLRLMGMDQRMAAKVWQNVMLFRRLFQDGGNAIFVDPSTFTAFTNYAKESVTGELYQLPKELRLGDYRTLQKLEFYNGAVAKSDVKQPLSLPTTFLNPAEVKKNYPELVQKRYLLKIVALDKNSLVSKVGLKETWNWEVEDANWAILKKQFPDLGVLNGNNREDRFTALESLNPKIRSKVDSFAQAAILETHPEWIAKGLENGTAKTIEVSLSVKKGSTHFIGLEDASALITLLDQAEINNDAANKNNKLAAFSADQRHFYRIEVLEKAPNEELITFAEANRSGTLDTLLDQKLKAYYEGIKTANAAKFQNEDKSWKSYGQVKEAVADLYFAKVLDALKTDSKKSPLSGDKVAPLRLRAYVQNIKDKIQKEPTKVSEFIVLETEKSQENRLSVQKPIADQWKLEKQVFQTNRSSNDEKLNMTELAAISEWSELKTAPNGGLYFIRKTDLVTSENISANLEKVKLARHQLSNDLQMVLGNRLAVKWKAQKALSLEYLLVNPEIAQID
ncbi:MAG: hypothetical protein H0U49_04080 [Parachlamydiaceae bacterium]|nr:hypothetical protein [Parachlamydiaceae bacterium]